MSPYESLVFPLDRVLAGLVGRAPRQGPVVLGFHRIERGPGRTSASQDPGLTVSIDQFERCVDHFLEAGYSFVATEKEARRAAERGDPSVMITFDDGYANTRLAFECLAARDLEAVLFVCPYYAETGTAFWWDVLWREGLTGGTSVDAIRQEQGRLGRLPWKEVHHRLEATFGPGAMRPRTEEHRPYTKDELRALAETGLVVLANHTVHHQVLVGMSADDVRNEVEGGGVWVRELTGAECEWLAYPDGAVDRAVAQMVGQLGVARAFTVGRYRSDWTVEAPEERLLMGRTFPRPHRGMLAQCRVASARSGVQAGRVRRRLRRQIGRLGEPGG